MQQTNFFSDCVLLTAGIALMVFATIQTVLKVMTTIQETGHCWTNDNKSNISHEGESPFDDGDDDIGNAY